MPASSMTNSASTAIVPAEAIGHALRNRWDSTPESGPIFSSIRVTQLAPRSAAIACTCSSRDRQTESSCTGGDSDDLDEFDSEGQRLSGKRMIGVDRYRLIGDVGNHEIHDLAIRALTLQLHADGGFHVLG